MTRTERNAMREANLALPRGIAIRFDSEWQEWQVHYPKGAGRTFAPAADLQDAIATAQDIARRTK